ncbi:glycosyltransferase family 9 protein [Dendrosporobacter sp. 1207_IL3150]|uniref:glycosyltransferase family 9 protein n=1 Tax=Dendrosporobacter sp. 1207_IL3150 TaxID=3084054 RepID=UPI002FD96BA8
MLANPRILIVRLSSIGDVLHCTPVARSLKEALPSCHITWIVGQVAADMVRFNPYIDEVHIWPREKWEKAMRSAKFKEAWQIWQDLKDYFKSKHFDIALDIHGLFLSGMVTAASKATRRIGMSNTRELNSLFMNEIAPMYDEDIHVIQRYLSILRPLNITTTDYKMTLETPKEADEFARNFLSTHGVKPTDKIVAVNPVTTWSAKNWPPENFAKVIQELAANNKILLCGGPSDKAVAEKIIELASVPVINAVGQTTLLEMAALLKLSNVLVVGDTGPLHMAVALGTPSVSIFGATAPSRFGPLDPGHIVLKGQVECAPCYKTVCKTKDIRCLKSVKPEAVIEQTLEILKSNPI